MKNVTSGTVARTIVLMLALVNQALAIMGKGTIDIADDTIYQLCSLGATVITAGIAWWKDNAISKKARANKELIAAIDSGNAVLAEPDENIDAEMEIDQETEDDDNGYDKEAE